MIPSVPRTFSWINHILGLKKSFSTLQRTEIIQNMFLDKNGNINYIGKGNMDISQTYENWTTHSWVTNGSNKKKISENKKYFEMNESEKTKYLHYSMALSLHRNACTKGLY